MTSRPFPLESKSAVVRAYFASPHFAGWPAKVVHDQAVRNWKARKGNLTGRVHPRDRIAWEAWRSITAKRYANLLRRAGVA